MTAQVHEPMLAPWEALLQDQENLSSLSQEDATKNRDDLKRMLESIAGAEAKRREVADRNSATMAALQKKLQAGSDQASILTQDQSDEKARSANRALLLQCSRLSNQLFEYGATLRQQRRSLTARMQTFDALLCYRKSAQSSFVLRHNAVNDESMLLANMATGECGSLSSFTVVEGLGKGSFGAVFLVEHNMKKSKQKDLVKGDDDSKKKETALLAVKMVARETVSSSEKRIRHLEIERRVMAQIRGHPFVITLHYALQSPAALFFVMDFCAGGDLFYHLCQRRHKPQASGMKHFSEEEVKFFSAQVVSALGHLHDNFIVYRDLKPENVMLDARGFVKLVDFGLAKENVRVAFDDPVSPCGSAMYVAPEVLGFSGGYMIDWWSLGVLIYELLTGSPPWNTKDRKELFKQIREIPIRVPRHVSTETGDFMLGLLHRNPSKRLGATGDAAQLKDTPFLRWVDWPKMLAREYDPPFKPTSSLSDGNREAQMRPVNFDAESSVAAMKTLDTLEKKFPPTGPEETVTEPSSFLDFEPVSGRLARRISSSLRAPPRAAPEPNDQKN